MNTTFTNAKNSKTSDSHRLLLNLTDKIDLKRKAKYIALSNPSTLLYMEKHKKVIKEQKI